MYYLHKINFFLCGLTGGGDLYTGSSGIAFMFLKLHKLEETRTLVPSSIQKAKTFIDHAKTKVSTKDPSNAMFLCGNAGIYAVSSVINKELNNERASQNDANIFLAGSSVCQKINYCEYGSDEILFGRAGYLSGIYWMNKNLSRGQAITQDTILKICETIIESGVKYSQQKKLSIPMMWECYGGKLNFN